MTSRARNRGVSTTQSSPGRDGEFRAASGLRLLPRDLLKIGQLVLAGGVWNGHQVVPGDWLKGRAAAGEGAAGGVRLFCGLLKRGERPGPH
jgi:CubicO group peptidase (beta-lactamase class C family)